MNHSDPELKRILKKNDEVELPMDEAFYERLHDKIMRAIDQAEIEVPSIWQKPRRKLLDHWKSWVVSGGSIIMILIASLQAPIAAKTFLNDSHVVQVVKNEDAFNSKTTEAPEVFSDSLIVYQNQSDFFVDVAERSFHDLSKEHIREIMGEAGP